MHSRTWRVSPAGGALVAVLFMAAGGTHADEPKVTRRDSVPRLLRAIEFGDYGSPVVRFGDLKGDGQIEALVVQEDASGGQDKIIVTCLTALDLEGKILWQVGKPDRRNVWTGGDTPVQIHDIDGDGRAEIALATSADAVLLDTDGKILFRKPMHHTQHAMIGRFRTDLSGKQAFFISREDAAPGASPKVLEALYAKSGELLWDNTKQPEADKDGVLTQAVVVENWTGNPNENFIVLNRRGNAPPAMLDGWGREVAVFPFPPRAVQPAGGRGPRDRYTGYYVKHINCYGDEREEILVYDENALYIYTNAAYRERPELYNDTIYNGRK